MTAPGYYNFTVSNHDWRDACITIYQKGMDTNNGIELNTVKKEDALQAIRDLLRNCVPSLVFHGHEYPTVDSVHVSVDDDLAWDITAAEVLAEPISYPEPNLLV